MDAKAVRRLFPILKLRCLVAGLTFDLPLINLTGRNKTCRIHLLTISTGTDKAYRPDASSKELQPLPAISRLVAVLFYSSHTTD